MKRYLPALRIVLSLSLLCATAYATETDDSLARAKKEGKAVMLELGSVGCIPCEQMRPVMTKLSSTYKGKLEVIFVDVRRDRAAAKQFRVYGIPTQVFLDKKGNEFHRHIGYYAYEQIVPVLKRAGL
jgi:thioredoxin 1